MTKDEVIKLLEPYPGNMPVMIQQFSDFAYSPVIGVGSKEIGYSESPGGKKLATEKVIVLSDDY